MCSFKKDFLLKMPCLCNNFTCCIGGGEILSNQATLVSHIWASLTKCPSTIPSYRRCLAWVWGHGLHTPQSFSQVWDASAPTHFGRPAENGLKVQLGHWKTFSFPPFPASLPTPTLPERMCLLLMVLFDKYYSFHLQLPAKSCILRPRAIVCDHSGRKEQGHCLRLGQDVRLPLLWWWGWTGPSSFWFQSTIFRLIDMLWMRKWKQFIQNVLKSIQY